MFRSAVLLALFAAAVSISSAPAHASASQTPSGFTIFASPKLPEGGALSSVAAVSASDVWAVGGMRVGLLIEHYNGTRWSVVPAPLLPATGILHGVSAHGSAVWAVGDTTAGNSEQGFVARYTGLKWVRVAIPTQFNPSPGSSDFDSVHVLSNTDVYVGGDIGPIVGGRPDLNSAIIHWNGKIWSQVNDVVYPYGTVFGIAGTSPTQLFSTGDSGGIFQREQPDGSWQALDPFGGRAGEWSGIAASSADNAWVVGRAYDSASDVEDPIAMRWNGTTATTISVPSYTTDHTLTGVVTTAPNDTWAVGSRGTALGGSETLIEHYTGGSSFTDLGGPNIAGAWNALTAIAAVPGVSSDLWAVGFGGGQPLILHHAP